MSDALAGQSGDRDFIQNSPRLSQRRRLCDGTAPRKRRSPLRQIPRLRDSGIARKRRKSMVGRGNGGAC
jgi:hypothetical protein